MYGVVTLPIFFPSKASLLVIIMHKDINSVRKKSKIK